MRSLSKKIIKWEVISFDFAQIEREENFGVFDSLRPSGKGCH
jgi:hypothetical protein